MLNQLVNNGAVLVLGPHPDDEVGCAGLLHRLTSQGIDVHHWFYSLCRESLSKLNYTPDMLLSECNASRRILGIKQSFCGNFDFPVRRFPEFRQEILETMIAFRNELKPSLVLVPNSNDIHQDHHVIFQEAIRAFKHSTVLGYELPWNTLSMHHECFVVLNEHNVIAKIDALESYHSQKNRVYANREFFRSLSKVRGVQANTEFSECYEVIRLIV